MLDLFAAAPVDLRNARLNEYKHYLIERDGELDMDRLTLSKREALMTAYETPPTNKRAMDPEEFRKNFVSYDKRKQLSDETMLLLALVKVNSAEAYGVSRNLQQAIARAVASNDDLEFRVLCEETYHTRILLSSANRYGIEVHEPYVPPTALRILIGGIASTPSAIARPLVFAAEIMGTLLFLNLIEVTRRVLKHDPETRDAIEERLSEICVDERGHISYNHILSGPATLAQTRLLLPILAKSMKSVMPEAVALGAFPSDILQQLPRISDPKRLPESVRRQAFLA